MLPKLDHCRSCVGYVWGTRGFSQVTGTGEIPLLVVGEASGATEEREGRPFIGQSGQLLDRVFKMSGLNRDSYSITNCLRCRPPNNELRGMPYEREALDHCRSYLDQVIEERRPRFILALGDTALRELSTTAGLISELRGFILTSRYGIPMLATYHPAFLMPRRDSPGAMHLLGVAAHDIRVAERCARLGIPKPVEVKYELEPTVDVVRGFLNRLEYQRDLPVAYDIETEGILGVKEPEALSEKKVIQIQFSSAVGEALVLPWPHEAALEILKTPNMKWGWFDRLFDRKVLRSQGVVINGETHDLMDAWGHCQPNFSSAKDDTHGDKGVPSKLMGLQSCLSFYYPEEGPWKGSVQQAIDEAGGQSSVRKGVTDTLRYYGAKDADYTYRLGVKLFASLKKNGLW